MALDESGCFAKWKFATILAVGCFKRSKNFKWLKFIPPTANSCYLGQNISWGQKIFQKFWFLDIPMSCQSFLKNHLVKWPFSVAIWSGKRKFNFLYFFNFKLYFCFVGVKCIWELWPFKVHHVHIDQKLSKWEGG